jgi:hypothetical protein
MSQVSLIINSNNGIAFTQGINGHAPSQITAPGSGFGYWWTTASSGAVGGN